MGANSHVWIMREQRVEDTGPGFTFRFEQVPRPAPLFRLRLFGLGVLALCNRGPRFCDDGVFIGGSFCLPCECAHPSL
jgi:hypothetical protein